jgi:hypothetical protein
MADRLLAWAEHHREVSKRNLAGLRSGVLKTYELRAGKQVNTTLETIAEQTRALAELDTAIDWRRSEEA